MVSDPSLERIVKHYCSVFKSTCTPISMSIGPWREIHPHFHVLEVEPTDHRELWTYATVGMSARARPALELHMVSMKQDRTLVELLTATAHYHVTGRHLDLGHAVNFGRGWQKGSQCDHGLISLPYLDGPSLEQCNIGTDRTVRCLWLIPITASEAKFNAEYGLELLEQRFDNADLQFADPKRASVV